MCDIVCNACVAASFNITRRNMQDVVRRIESGDARAGIVIPPNYAVPPA